VKTQVGLNSVCEKIRHRNIFVQHALFLHCWDM